MHVFSLQYCRNLRLQSLDAHTQASDGHPKPLYGHQKPANGDFCPAKIQLQEGQKQISGHLFSFPVRLPGLSCAVPWGEKVRLAGNKIPVAHVILCVKGSVTNNRTIMRKIIPLLILAMLMLSSCDNDPANKVTLSRRQLAQAIEGYYQGHYRVLWGDLGTGAAEEDSVGCVSMDVQDWDHRTVVFNDFPLHLITKVVGEESPLAEALRERPTVEVLSYYSFLIPNDNSVALYIKPQGFHITAPYGGRVAHLFFAFSDASRFYGLSRQELQGKMALRSQDAICVRLLSIKDDEGRLLFEDTGKGAGSKFFYVDFVPE